MTGRKQFGDINANFLPQKNPLSMNDVKQVLINWKGKKEHRIFPSDL